MKWPNPHFKMTDLPPVPAMAARISELIDDPTTTLDDLQEAIMVDQALAGRTLKIANSAFYNVRRTISTISEAISMLGMNTIRMITLAAFTRDAFKKFGIIEQRMWEHSLGVSVAAGLLAGETPILKKEEAFVAGLLHDVGKVIMDNTRPEQIVILLQRVHEERRTFISLDQEIFGYTHPEMGFYLAENWGFPPHLCTVIRDHHSLDSLADSDPDIYQKALCQTVALSDALCARLGIGYREAMPDLDLHEEQWMEALRIDKIKYADLIDIFKETYLHEKISFLDL